MLDFYLNVLVVLTLPTNLHNHHHNGTFLDLPLPDALSWLTLPLAT